MPTQLVPWLWRSCCCWQQTPKTPKKMTNNSTDTPRTDAMPSNQPMLSAQSDPVELYHKLIAVTVDFGKALDACVEYQDQLAASQAEVERLTKEGELYQAANADVKRIAKERNKAEAEVAKLNHQLLKTESDLLQSQDINSFLDTEFRIACKRAEKAEAERDAYKKLATQPVRWLWRSCCCWPSTSCPNHE